MGHGARGLLGRRRLLGLLPARPRPQPGLPLGRGRPARHLRPRVPAVLRARAVERARPDPQGAALRPDRPRGQPRRGRQGVLLLPRLDADALVHEGALQVPAGASSPTRGCVEENRRRGRRRARVRARRHRRLRRATATSTCSPSTPRPRPTTSSIRITVANRGPEAATLHVLPTLWFRNTWSWGCTDEGYWPKPRAARRSATARSRAEHADARAGSCSARRAAGRRRRPSCSSPRTRRTSQRLFGVPNRDAAT